MDRRPQAPIDPRFTARWSPRSFEERPLSAAQVASLFEAARWAPSCFNEQPWLFVYGITDEDRQRVAAVLAEGNRVWAARAPMLGVVFAKRRFDRNGKPNRWAQFDSGAAGFALALQANELGLAAHFMGGFDATAAHEALAVPEADYEAMAAFAVGYRGSPDLLPEELREREGPSDRQPPAQVAHQGRYSPD